IVGERWLNDNGPNRIRFWHAIWLPERTTRNIETRISQGLLNLIGYIQEKYFGLWIFWREWRQITSFCSSFRSNLFLSRETHRISYYAFRVFLPSSISFQNSRVPPRA